MPPIGEMQTRSTRGGAAAEAAQSPPQLTLEQAGLLLEECLGVDSFRGGGSEGYERIGRQLGNLRRVMEERPELLDDNIMEQLMWRLVNNLLDPGAMRDVLDSQLRARDADITAALKLVSLIFTPALAHALTSRLGGLILPIAAHWALSKSSAATRRAALEALKDISSCEAFKPPPLMDSLVPVLEVRAKDAAIKVVLDVLADITKRMQEALKAVKVKHRIHTLLEAGFVQLEQAGVPRGKAGRPVKAQVITYSINATAAVKMLQSKFQAATEGPRPLRDVNTAIEPQPQTVEGAAARHTAPKASTGPLKAAAPKPTAPVGAGGPASEAPAALATAPKASTAPPTVSKKAPALQPAMSAAAAASAEVPGITDAASTGSSGQPASSVAAVAPVDQQALAMSRQLAQEEQQQNQRGKWDPYVSEAVKSLHSMVSDEEIPLAKAERDMLLLLCNQLPTNLKAVQKASCEGLSVTAAGGMCTAQTTAILEKLSTEVAQLCQCASMLMPGADDMRTIRLHMYKIARLTIALPILGGAGGHHMVSHLQLGLVMVAALQDRIADLLGCAIPGALDLSPEEALAVHGFDVQASARDLLLLRKALPNMMAVFGGEMVLGLLSALLREDLPAGNALERHFSWMRQEEWMSPCGPVSKVETLEGQMHITHTLQQMSVAEVLEVEELLVPREALHLRARLMRREGVTLDLEDSPNLPEDVRAVAEMARAFFDYPTVFKLMELVMHAAQQLGPGTEHNQEYMSAVGDVVRALRGMSVMIDSGIDLLPRDAHARWVLVNTELNRLLASRLHAMAFPAVFKKLLMAPAVTPQLKVAPEQVETPLPWYECFRAYPDDKKDRQQMRAAMKEAAKLLALGKDIAAAQAAVDFVEAEHGTKRRRM